MFFFFFSFLAPIESAHSYASAQYAKVVVVHSPIHTSSIYAHVHMVMAPHKRRFVCTKSCALAHAMLRCCVFSTIENPTLERVPVAGGSAFWVTSEESFSQICISSENSLCSTRHDGGSANSQRRGGGGFYGVRDVV